MLEIESPRLGEAQRAAIAIEQTYPESLLERHHVLADHRGGEVQPFGRGNETPRLDDVSKNPNAGERVHVTCRGCNDYSLTEGASRLRASLKLLPHGTAEHPRKGYRGVTRLEAAVGGGKGHGVYLITARSSWAAKLAPTACAMIRVRQFRSAGS